MDAGFHRASEWKIIRLELARTPEYPSGSASRAYILRLPVYEDGMIDEDAVKEHRSMATVRRFWPNEPDQQGYVVKAGDHWAFSYRVGEDDDESLFHLETHPLAPGEFVTLTEPDGRQFPFKVAEVAR